MADPASLFASLPSERAAIEVRLVRAQLASMRLGELPGCSERHLAASCDVDSLERQLGLLQATRSTLAWLRRLAPRWRPAPQRAAAAGFAPAHVSDAAADFAETQPSCHFR